MVALFLAGASLADDKLPWRFGATPDEIKSTTAFGPYKPFSNGDLETFRGVFDGKDVNVQFFFSDGLLRRIGFYLYEGADVQAAADKWLTLYDSMSVRYGRIKSPEIEDLQLDSAALRAAFSERAATTASVPGKSQMAPKQPSQDYATFASFWGADYNGARMYYVVLYYDKRP